MVLIAGLNASNGLKEVAVTDAGEIKVVSATGSEATSAHASNPLSLSGVSSISLVVAANTTVYITPALDTNPDYTVRWREAAAGGSASTVTTVTRGTYHMNPATISAGSTAVTAYFLLVDGNGVAANGGALDRILVALSA